MAEIGKQYRFDYPEVFTTLPAYAAHRGHTVTVLRELDETEYVNENNNPMYRVRAEDGWEGNAWDDELVPIVG